MRLKKQELMHCRVCNSIKIHSVLNLGQFYLSDFTKTKKLPASYPLHLVICNACWLVQLKETPPPEKLYTERYGYRSGISNTIKSDLQNVVHEATAFLSKMSLKKHVVIDIGANDGTLLSFYPKSYKRIAFEPVKKFAKECEKYADIVINDYFSYRKHKTKLASTKANVITAISCFYDLEDPNAFITDILELLDQNGVFVIQQNYLLEMVKNNAFDNIVHEHIEYYSLHSLEKLLERHNLEVISVKLTGINGGSFRTVIARRGQYKKDKSVAKFRNNEKKYKLDDKQTYVKFSERVKKEMKKLSDFIKKESKKGKSFYVLGASTRGNTILQYLKIDNTFLQKAIERNQEKWGKYISSMGIPIISEEEARHDNPDYMLVLPWFFRNEIVAREHKYVKKGGKLIFPLPKFQIHKEN